MSVNYFSIDLQYFARLETNIREGINTQLLSFTIYLKNTVIYSYPDLIFLRPLHKVTHFHLCIHTTPTSLFSDLPILHILLFSVMIYGALQRSMLPLHSASLMQSISPGSEQNSPSSAKVMKFQLEKLIVVKVVKKFSAFLNNPRTTGQSRKINYFRG